MNNPPSIQSGDTAVILAALQFTVEKHLRELHGQPDNGGYINRRILVTEILSRVGQINDATMLTAAILHEVYDGSQELKREFDHYFGPEVRVLVQELSENKRLSQPERLQALLDHAHMLSPKAKQIVVAEKICRLQELAQEPAKDWSLGRMHGYMTWLAQVVSRCRGVNERLDCYFDELYLAQIERVHQFYPEAAA
ncbi:MAG: HD domain-containing protein [Methylacidiphilales bacterium]|nr:HD domain-containing protein [Candidatus Methylacidiphilales bacterium]